MSRNKHRKRRTITEKLVQEPESEIGLWILWTGAMLFCTVATAQSLLLTIPIGVYLFACRQRASRERKRAALPTQVPPYSIWGEGYNEHY